MPVFENIKVFKNRMEHKTFKGNGTVLLGGVVEVNFNIFFGSKGLFVKLPQRSYKDATTQETKYVSEVKIPDEDTYRAFCSAVLAEYKRVANVKETPKDETPKDETPATPENSLPF